MKTAIIIGASGLVGKALLYQLLTNKNYNQIIVLVRKELTIKHDKLIQHIIDFNQIKQYAELIKGDELYCCLGTTIKKAGSQEVFEKIDYQYVVDIAQIFKKNGGESFSLVSAMGANEKSSIFYNRIKGKTENAITEFKFEKTTIVRPSLLIGSRNEFRLGEYIAQKIFAPFAIFMVGPLKNFKPIKVEEVAKALIFYTNSKDKGLLIKENSSLFVS